MPGILFKVQRITRASNLNTCMGKALEFHSYLLSPEFIEGDRLDLIKGSFTLVDIHVMKPCI